MNKTVNRSVLVIVPKKPYYDWANSLAPGEKPIEKYDECNSYLLDDEWDISIAEQFLKLNFDEFFKELLHGAWTNESVWPEDRTWEMFLDWFDWHFSSLVWDVFPDKKIEWEEF